jgi:hypothetical protein
MPRLAALTLALTLTLPAVGAEPSQPDPNAVRRHGPGYRYPQHGWTVVHIEGEPYDRGHQHGTLLAREIGDYVRNLAVQQSKAAPADAWAITRTMVSALFLRKFDREWLDEMQGIADGAAAGGASFDGRPVDLLDVVCLNVQMEYETLDNGLDALPTGLEGVKRPRQRVKPDPVPAADHCSAFAATGPATKDGKLVIGHITMSGLGNALASNVWIDVKPAKGNRVVMQGFPGAIWSAQDYYLNSKGIVLTETTIKQSRFNPDGLPLTARARRAMQYGNSIDDVVKALTEKNNGLYTNDWLLGDANTNEIASLELGTTTHKLRRSSQNDWHLPGVDGFYWGCNNTKDQAVRIDTFPGLLGRPQDLCWCPTDRDRAWLKLYQQHRGKIDADFGKLAFRTPPLAAHPSLDAKVTTADLANKLESHALFGPPYGRVWVASPRELERYHDVRDFVPNDWTVLTPAAPAGDGNSVAIDLNPDKLPNPYHTPHTAPAWQGTVLPKGPNIQANVGLAAYERIVALENAGVPAEQVELALFRYRAEHLAAKAREPKWRVEHDESIDALTAELDRPRAVRMVTGGEVLGLHVLRGFLGKDKFVAAVGEFSRANAGKPASWGDLQADLAETTGKDIEGFLNAYKPPAIEGRPVSVNGWVDEPEDTLVVYGTAADAVGNKAAAEAFQAAFRVRWTNITIPAVADKDVTDEQMKGKHLILIGRPAANAVSKRFASAVPATFGPASATVNGKVCAHDRTAVAAAGVNPLDQRFSVVILAGLSADATYHTAVQFAGGYKGAGGPPAAEAVVYPQGKAAVPVLVRREKPSREAAARGE